jgi:hypothetical protein
LYCRHDDVVAVPQTPAPLQTRGSVAVAPLQLESAHSVPLTYFRHPPAPSQVPSFPHIAATAIGHCDATIGGLPAAIGVHVPSEQDMHVPVQALLQQTLFTQCPDAQSASRPDAQVPPIGILPQLELTQLLPAVQSLAVEVHDVLHAPVPHWYGAHELVVAARQVPKPSHDRGDDSVDPVQLAAPHAVPAW